MQIAQDKIRQLSSKTINCIIFSFSSRVVFLQISFTAYSWSGAHNLRRFLCGGFFLSLPARHYSFHGSAPLHHSGRYAGINGIFFHSAMASVLYFLSANAFSISSSLVQISAPALLLKRSVIKNLHPSHVSALIPYSLLLLPPTGRGRHADAFCSARRPAASALWFYTVSFSRYMTGYTRLRSLRTMSEFSFHPPKNLFTTHTIGNVETNVKMARITISFVFISFLLKKGLAGL